MNEELARNLLAAAARLGERQGITAAEFLGVVHGDEVLAVVRDMASGTLTGDIARRYSCYPYAILAVWDEVDPELAEIVQMERYYDRRGTLEESPATYMDRAGEVLHRAGLGIVADDDARHSLGYSRGSLYLGQHPYPGWRGVTLTYLPGSDRLTLYAVWNWLKRCGYTNTVTACVAGGNARP